MSLLRRASFMALAVSVFLTTPGLADSETEAKKAELERVLGRLREAAEAKASLAELTFPEDTSPRFTVRELRISGNELISTAKLLENLPLAYTVSVQEDDTTVEEVYDFRVLYDIILEPGRERQVSLKSIQGFTKYLLSVYQKKGYLGIYVYVPAAAIEGPGKLVDQILPVEVLEGRVAELTVERYNFDRERQEEGFLKDSVIKAWSPVKEGDAIKKKKLDDFVGLLNLNPDRYVSAVISRSAEPNALNLGYDVYEENPWHWYVQVDNAGTEDRQWAPRIGVINTNLTGADDRFSAMYQAPWEKGIEEEYALFGSYDFPVFTPRLRLNVYAGYSQFDIPQEGVNFIGNGSFYGSQLRYNMFQAGGWFFDVTGSLSFERSKVTPSIGSASDVDMELWGVGVNVHRSDDRTDTSLLFRRTESMGGSDEDEFAAARPGAVPDFTIYDFTAAHSQYLDPNRVNRVSGFFRLIASNERLVPAKMTPFGGLYSVRGYEEDEIVADGGILVSGQYEFDLVKHAESLAGPREESEERQAEKPWVRKLAPLAFVDYGRAKIKDPFVAEREIRELVSIGVGTIVELGDSFSAGVYYGWPLRGTDETDRGDGRFNFSFLYRF